MEDSPKYAVSYIAAPPTPGTRASLTPFALTCCQTGSDEKTQQCYYLAEKVESVLQLDEEIIDCHTREIAALRRYIDVFQQELLAHPELPDSIGKVVYAHRQTLIVAQAESLLDHKECNACGGLGYPNCHGGVASEKEEVAHA